MCFSLSLSLFHFYQSIYLFNYLSIDPSFYFTLFSRSPPSHHYLSPSIFPYFSFTHSSLLFNFSPFPLCLYFSTLIQLKFMINMMIIRWLQKKNCSNQLSLRIQSKAKKRQDWKADQMNSLFPTSTRRKCILYIIEVCNNTYLMAWKWQRCIASSCSNRANG